MATSLPLIQQLRNILPEILKQNAANVEDAKNGTELIALLKPQLQGPSKDKESSIRATLSILANDQTSVIAKVPGAQGYFLRDSQDVANSEVELQTEQMAEIQADGPALPDIASEGGRDLTPEEKFRALYIRSLELDKYWAAHIEHTASKKGDAGINVWKYPDVIFINRPPNDKETGKVDEEFMEVAKGFGDQLLQIASVELKPWISLGTLRANFFQCVSNSKWAHRAILAIGTRIADEGIEEELKRLANSYDVEVVSYGLTKEAIAGLPSASIIMAMKDDQIDHLIKSIGFSETRIGGGKNREQLDWGHIFDVRSLNRDIRNVFTWITYCIKRNRSTSVSDYIHAREKGTV